MSLFALLGVPSFALLVFALHRWLNPAIRSADPPARMGARAAAPRLPLLHLLWGLLYAIPCFFLGRLLAGIFPQSYRPFLLFLRILVQDQLFQVGFLALASFTFLRAASFQALAFFGAGYLSLIGFAASLATAGVQDAYALFLLPATRMAALALWPMLFSRRRESFGLERVVLSILLALLPLLCALVGWLFARHWTVWAGALSAALLAASLAGIAVQYQE
jgi:hypothetical protein